jgi:hypothetical protein
MTHPRGRQVRLPGFFQAQIEGKGELKPGVGYSN